MFERRTYISDKEAQYFVEHTLMCADAPPTKGSYKVGDIVISANQKDDIFGWVCVTAGSPGTWEVIVDLKLIKEAIDALEKQDVAINSNISILKAGLTKLGTEALALDAKYKAELERINGRVATNAENITTMNNVITGNKNNIAAINEKVVKAEQALTAIHNQVGNNGVASKDEVTDLAGEVDDLKDLLGANTEGDEEAREGILQQLEELRELIGANTEGDEENQKGIIQKIEALEELIGANAEDAEEAKGGILEEIAKIKEMLGFDENSEAPTGGLLEEFEELKELIGRVPNGDSDPGSGLIKEVEDLKEEVDNVREEALKFWVGTLEEYQNLTVINNDRLYIIID